jgi:AGCS family alanine or glycine:cation symporter
MKRFGLLLLMLLAFPTPALAAEEDSSATFLDFLDWVDTSFSEAVAAIKTVFFFQVGGGVPIIVAWLILGGIYFTLRMGFVNLRGFKHAIQVLLGKYQDQSGVGEEGEGEVSPFQAVSTALSATVGLGSIAGSAIAIQLGGPGAVVWMSLAGFLGMSSKFVECTLGQKYRMVRTDGTIAGGPMYYLSQGLSEMGVPWLGKSLAVLFALLCVGASFGAGNMFQANQSYAAVANVVPYLADRSWLYGFAIALLVGVVIVGGISRIGAVTSNLVPVVVALYIVGCLWIILSNYAEIPIVLTTMLKQAFSAEAIEGGFIGVLVQGIRRAAFSNGAGIGSAAIAHSATRNKEPVREGMVASIEPLIDTIIICNLTGMVVVITGVSEISAASGANGIELTAAAFNTVIGWFPVVLAIAVVLFAFSNIIAWSYYGEQAWTYLFGAPSTLAFKALFVIFVFIGTVVNLGAVLDFSDMMLLGMAVPNLLGCFLLSGKVAADLKTYMSKLKLEKMPVPQANSTASDEKSTGRTEN